MTPETSTDAEAKPLAWLQRERGSCSEPDCDLPIAGWCQECDARRPVWAPKLCAAHLMEHCEGAGHTPYVLYPAR